MNYSEFIDIVMEEVREMIGDEYLININNVIKNNGVRLQGLSIRKKGNDISPTIYLNNYFDEYQSGRSINSIVEDILHLHSVSSTEEKIDVEFFSDFNQVKDKIVYKLVNYDKNRELLKEIPHMAYLDLAIVFYCIISEENFGNATILLYNSHLRMWNTDIQMVYKVALENTPKLLKCDLRSMEEVVLELLAGKCEDGNREYCETKELMDMVSEDENPNRMYILSNRNKLNGAAVILYKDVLKRFAEKLEKDLYILPSSIHEVILIPAEESIVGDDLSQMVKDVNQTQVEPAEVLSDHVYYFSRIENRVVCGM